MTKGVILIALGHAYYGRMALVLAASIRFFSDVPITLYCDIEGGSHLTFSDRRIFTNIKAMPKEYYAKGYLQSKTHLYDLSEYEQTLYLDVDMVLCNNVETIFSQLSDSEFTIKNNGYCDLSKKITKPFMWVSEYLVKQAYGLTDERYYDYGSELIYFTKSPANAAYFEKVKEIYNSPLVKLVDFAGEPPDEPSFSIASALLNHYPHQDNYKPIFFRMWNNDKDISYKELQAKYIGISIGGHSNTNSAPIYQMIANEVCAKMEVTGWRFKNKKDFLDKRRKTHKWIAPIQYQT